MSESICLKNQTHLLTVSAHMPIIAIISRWTPCANISTPIHSQLWIFSFEVIKNVFFNNVFNRLMSFLVHLNFFFVLPKVSFSYAKCTVLSFRMHANSIKYCIALFCEYISLLISYIFIAIFNFYYLYLKLYNNNVFFILI